MKHHTSESRLITVFLPTRCSFPQIRVGEAPVHFSMCSVGAISSSEISQTSQSESVVNLLSEA